MKPFSLPTVVSPQKDDPLTAKQLPKTDENIISNKLGKLVLGKSISAGGEGTIYSIIGNNSIVCKIYHSEKLTLLRKQKIELMITRDITYKGICWPIDIVYNKYNQFVGYIMPIATGKPMQTSMFIKPALLKNFHTFTRKNLCDIAISFLEKMKFLHSLNIIVGDINALNILVEQNGDIWFVDIDSYQIENFSCPVGTVNFTAPEIQGKDYATFLRTKDHELYAIATMLFMILLPGKPPYSQQGGESQSDNIKKMNFPYWCNEKADVNPPEGSWNFIWSHLTRKLRDNFCMTFKRNQRSSIDEWINVLKSYSSAIEKSHSSSELFPSGFPVRDPIEVNCSKCNTKHTNSKLRVNKMILLNKGVLCNNCFKEIKLKSLAKQSYNSRFSNDINKDNNYKNTYYPKATYSNQNRGVNKYTNNSQGMGGIYFPKNNTSINTNSQGNNSYNKKLNKIDLIKNSIFPIIVIIIIYLIIINK